MKLLNKDEMPISTIGTLVALGAEGFKMDNTEARQERSQAFLKCLLNRCLPGAEKLLNQETVHHALMDIMFGKKKNEVEYILQRTLEIARAECLPSQYPSYLTPEVKKEQKELYENLGSIFVEACNERLKQEPQSGGCEEEKALDEPIKFRSKETEECRITLPREMRSLA